MSETDKVVALPGFTVPRSQSDPVVRVVEICEELLADAKTGKLRAVAVAKVLADPQIITETEMFAGPSPDRYVLIAAVQMLGYRISRVADGDAET